MGRNDRGKKGKRQEKDMNRGLTGMDNSGGIDCGSVGNGVGVSNVETVGQL